MPTQMNCHRLAHFQEISELKEQFDCARNLQDADVCANCEDGFTMVDVWGLSKRRSVYYTVIYPEMALFDGKSDDKQSNLGALSCLIFSDKPL